MKTLRENILARLNVFEKIQNKATDEVGWIALTFSVTRGKAKKMIDEARSARLNPEDAVIWVGTIAGEMKDAAQMYYDHAEDKEIRERLNMWSDKLLDAWKVLTRHQMGQ